MGLDEEGLREVLRSQKDAVERIKDRPILESLIVCFNIIV
jgi:hypothetical protein